MIDQMSDGRLMLGVGRGISPIELRYYGLDPEKTPAMYRRIAGGHSARPDPRNLNFEGELLELRDVPMEMTPYQRPHPPLWYGLGRADHMPWCVKHKVNIVGNLGGPGMRAITDRYRKEWRGGRHATADMPLMGVGRHVVVAETNKEALEVARTGYGKWRESFLKLG